MTPKEKAKEYADSLRVSDSHLTQKQIEEYAITDFLAGYKSAQESDQEAAKLETDITPETFTINDMYVESKLLFDCQDKLNNLQIENKQLKDRIEELESEKSTELITKNEGSFYDITTTKCCGIGPITNENFCPNCGRKIMR